MEYFAVGARRLQADAPASSRPETTTAPAWAPSSAVGRKPEHTDTDARDFGGGNDLDSRN